MVQWFEDLAGPEYATAILWTFAALVLFLIVLIIIKLIRSLTFGTFVAGGRNRKTRLAVMDATAVDSHRRLVLVRRDDIEHLLLIGGPTDVVVERDIRIGQPRRPALTGETVPQHEPQPQPRQRPAEPPPQARPAPRQPSPQPAPPQQMVERPRPTAPQQVARPVVREPAPQPQRPSPPRPAPPPVASPAIVAPPRQQQAYATPSNSLDDTLLKELEVSFDEPAPGKPAKLPELSLDEEMTKLLGELSSQKR